MLVAFSLVLTVKKKSSAGLKLSNLMNLGRKKSTSLEPPERSLETASKNLSHLLDQRACPLGWSPSPGQAAQLMKAGVLGLALNVSTDSELVACSLSSLQVVLRSNQTLAAMQDLLWK